MVVPVALNSVCVLNLSRTNEYKYISYHVILFYFVL